MDRQRLNGSKADYSYVAIKAAAGCGKTYRIAQAVKEMANNKECCPALILTHTHAGVDSLRKKLKVNSVPPANFHIDTIAAWALRYSGSFPAISGLTVTEPNDEQWEDVYLAAARLLKNSSAREIVPISYCKVYVDEYQDCTLNQHELILGLGKLIPCRILGDPLQGIFNIGGSTLIDWDDHVVPHFHIKEVLTTPWRWKQTPELGEWLSSVRNKLENNQPIDLTSLPSSVIWKQLPSNGATANVQREACFNSRNNGTTVAIHNINNQCYYVVKGLRGMFSCVEAINCKDLMDGAEKIHNASGGARALEVLAFAKKCMTQVNTILSSVQEQAFRDNKTPSWRSNNQHKDQLASLVEVAGQSSLAPVSPALQTIRKNTGTVLCRKELFYEMLRAINEFEGGDHDFLREAAWHVRNITRRSGRKIGQYTIGTTLLVKGLEFDHSIILDADGMDKKNLYVAMTRGAKSLTILSRGTVLNPKDTAKNGQKNT